MADNLLLDHLFLEHPKVVGLTDAEKVSLLRLMLWSAGQQTGGVVPARVPKALGVSGDLAALVGAGLVDRNGRAWRLHDWEDWNPPGRTDQRARARWFATRRQRRWRRG